MLTQADIQTIATVFNKTADEISGAISSETDSSLDLRLNGTIKSQAELDQLRESGVQQGKQLGSKELAKALEIDLDAGEKDPSVIAEKLRSTLSSKYEAQYKNMTPSEEMEALRQKLTEAENSKAKISETYETKLAEVEEWQNKYTSLQTDIVERDKSSAIRKYLKDPEKSGLTHEQQLALFKMDYKVDSSDDGFIVKDGDNVVLNPTGQPETLENVVKVWLDNQKFTRTRAGMGGGDRSGQGSGLPKGLSDQDAISYLTDKGIDPMSSEGGKTFLEITKQ